MPFRCRDYGSYLRQNIAAMGHPVPAERQPKSGGLSVAALQRRLWHYAGSVRQTTHAEAAVARDGFSEQARSRKSCPGS
ncbi:hypothetical protein NDU88_005700 [Pleurodeles waltl]|uniref:Uncharacterized protein n=1 Tax=Pleurodeles waltl TaxID=8319 RepID=A0AAV7SMN5_PLEWA|nr:hypothetical protein NDU88_005700 [Pleurodeles waltl]